tara:strand:+ start:1121 stop:5476 length:4356 start_codon:yes stop_codon:yes gene_type:complete
MKKLILLFTLFSLSLHAQVFINEYSAANYDDIDFLPGPGRNYADWIELYNAGAASVDLSGYYLSDRISTPLKWQIPPGTTIAAGAHLLFLADKQDGFSNGNYHTNFKLTQTSLNEAIVFSDAAGIIVDSISLNYPNKKHDSRCRMTDGSAIWGISGNPTNGTSNNNSIERYALTPSFDIPAGFYTVGATLTVTLSTTEPNSSIRYTLDGSEPNSASNLYTTPISMTTTTVIRAKTYSTNANISSSLTETNTYFVNETHGTKVISIAGGTGITTLLGGSFNEPDGSFELFETDGTFLTEATGEFNKHGNDSWAYAQRGLDFVARDQYGKNYALEDEIFDQKNRDKFQRVILKCGASDNYPFEGTPNDNYPGEYGGAHVRDAFINELSQRADLRLDERTTEFAVMYVNGNYWGVYDIREKVDDHDFTNYYYDQDRNNLQYLKTWGPTWSEYGGAQAQTDWDALVQFINTNNMTVPANYAYVDSVFNTGSLIDYFILNGYTVVADWLNWNTAWWRGMDPTGDKKKWRYTLWDMDASFNHYTNYSNVPNQGASADPCDPAVLGNLGGQGHVPIWNALLGNDDFFADYINRYAELASTAFSCDSLHNLLDEMIGEIEPEMPAHIVRWGGTMTEWENNVDSIHAFIDTRCTNILAQLVLCEPAISGPYDLTIIVQPPGSGEVQLSSITPSVYPFTATYFGGVNISLDADANECFEFDHWTIENDTILPNDTTENIFFTMSSNDTITVFFNAISCPSDDTIYINVQPQGAGSINIDGNSISTFPATAYVLDSANHTFDAIANTGFTFANWDWDIHTAAPSVTSTNTLVYTYSNDTLTVNFTAPTVDTIIYIVQPTGAGTITVDGTNITTFPNTTFYADATNSSLSATANTGYTFNNWDFTNNTALPNATTNNITTTWSSNDTVYVNFDPILIDTIVYIVQPAGAGAITVDGTNITVFPNTTIYTNAMNSNLSATANTGYIFSNWSFNNNSPLPNNTSNNITTTWSSNDTVYVNFDPIPVDTVVYIVQPAGAGNITVDATNIFVFPNTSSYANATSSSLSAIANIGYTFNNWSFNNNTPLPNTTNVNITTTWNSNDTVYVNFDPIVYDSITYIIQPIGAGYITVGATTINTFPANTSYLDGSNSNLSAFSNAGFTFNHWEFDNNTPLPNNLSSNIAITWQSNDTVIVHFNIIPTYDITYLVNPIGTGTIDINGVNASVFPATISYLQGANVTLNANANPNYTFDFWQTDINIIMPNINTVSSNFNVMADDTIVAHLDEFNTDTLWIITNPTGVAELQVGSDIINSSPYMGVYELEEILQISATANGSNVFNQWNLSTVNLPDYNTSTYFTFLTKDTLFAYFNNVLAIENIGDDLNEVKIYPTIVDNSLTIEISSHDATNLNIDLLNISGQVVQHLYNEDLNAQSKMKEQFTISDVSQGIYFVKLNSDKTNVTYKIVKIK